MIILTKPPTELTYCLEQKSFPGPSMTVLRRELREWQNMVHYYKGNFSWGNLFRQ